MHNKSKTDYLRMSMGMGKNYRLLNLGNQILSNSDPLLRPIVKRVRKTVKYLRYKSRKIVSKQNEYYNISKFIL